MNRTPASTQHFVDITKAFDAVNRTGLLLIMENFCCPPRFIMMVRELHDGMQAHIPDDGNQSSPFEVIDGVKQISV